MVGHVQCVNVCMCASKKRQLLKKRSTNCRRRPYEHKKKKTDKIRHIRYDNHESEGGQVLVEKDGRSGTNKRTKNVLCCFLKRRVIYFGCALTHADGIPPPLPVELPRVDADDGGGAPDGGGGGGSAVGSSIPISS